jgi:serine phosphatase RsbU (regulator of sigma subunit)
VATASVHGDDVMQDAEERRATAAVEGGASLSSEKLTERVVEKVEEFVQEAERSDDITLLAVRRR